MSEDGAIVAQITGGGTVTSVDGSAFASTGALREPVKAADAIGSNARTHNRHHTPLTIRMSMPSLWD